MDQAVMEGVHGSGADVGHGPPDGSTTSGRYGTVASTDAVEFSELVHDWHFEFTQLQRGTFSANGAVVDLDGVSVARVAESNTLLHQGHAPLGMVALLIPGAGSGDIFAHAQLLEPGHCVTLSEGAGIEAVSHGRYIDVAVGFDLRVCQRQIDALTGGSIGVEPGAVIAAPGRTWTDALLARVEWLLAAAAEQPGALEDARVRASLLDHMLTGMAHFASAPADIDATTRSERASRRVAIRLAREFIHARLSEPLRLSELCRHARLKVRSLEYGFREVTGLTPIAYVRTLRLNKVRRALLHDDPVQPRSISVLATDAGFWHLSQFAKDYRLTFGESPTETRRRRAARAAGRLEN